MSLRTELLITDKEKSGGRPLSSVNSFLEAIVLYGEYTERSSQVRGTCATHFRTTSHLALSALFALELPLPLHMSHSPLWIPQQLHPQLVL